MDDLQELMNQQILSMANSSVASTLTVLMEVVQDWVKGRQGQAEATCIVILAITL